MADNEKLNKALADTKAAYTKGQQELAAIKAEMSVLEAAGVKIPTEIADLKAEKPEEYAAALEKFNQKLTKDRMTKAAEAKSNLVAQTLNTAAEAAGMTVDAIKSFVPPALYASYTNGELSASQIVTVAQQYKTGKVVTKSPTTPGEFNISNAAGDIELGGTPEVDETQNPKDYII